MATSIPPHNVGEICAALLHLIKYPKSTIGKLVEFKQEMVSLSHAYGVVFRNRKGTFTARWFNERKKD